MKTTDDSVVLGRYSLLRLIGEDSLASIYLARAEGNHGIRKPVLVRLVHPHIVASPGERDTLIREADVASQLTHPNIVQTLDFGEHDHHYVETTEYVHGYELATLMSYRAGHNEMWSLKDASHVILEVLRAVAFAHAQRDVAGQPLNVIHGLISPHNIIVSGSGQVKIGGFGVADTRSEINLLSLNERVKGKLAYQSPEQVRGEEASQQTDIFALAAIYFELLAGIRLFHSDISEAETIKNVLDADVPAIESIRTDLPPETGMVLARGLARDRHRRFAEPSEFAAHINNLLRSSNEQGHPEDFENTVKQIVNNKMFLEYAPPLIDLDSIMSGPPLDRSRRQRSAGGGTNTAEGSPNLKSGHAPPQPVGQRRRMAIFVGLLAAVVTTVAGLALVHKTNRGATAAPNQPVAVIVERSGPTQPSVDTGRQPSATAPASESGNEPDEGNERTVEQVQSQPPESRDDESSGETSPRPQKSRRSSRGRANTAAPTLDGPTVSRLLHRRQTALRQCAQRHPEEAAGYEGLTVRIMIDGQGSPREVTIRPPAVGATALGDCLATVIRGVRFPAHGGAPLIFDVPLYIRTH